MKLEELTLAMVTKALDAYFELAYGSRGAARNRPDRALADDAGRDAILTLFQCETVPSGRRRSLDRFTMRLGNRNYPFMKLLLQEHIVPGEFYFAVDSHDDMEIRPDFPDYDAWITLRNFNQELKKQIEARFADVGLPTSATIRELCAERRSSSPDGGVPGDATILIVDDEADLASALEDLLAARGYRVHKASDGPAGLDAARRIVPDMVLLDYEMPEMDGLEVLAALREDPATRRIPVLLCTASKIGVGDMRKAEGFLAKPFEEDLLYEMVLRVLSVGRSEVSR